MTFKLRDYQIESVEAIKKDWADGKKLERGSNREFERVCPDGFVYNLEVENHHTYTANGIVVHNCHHASAATYQDVYKMLRVANPDMRHLGVTATPLRADGVGIGEVFETVSATYDIRYLVKRKFLVNPRWLAVKTAISLAGVASHSKDGESDFSAKQLANVFETDNCFELVVETHKKYAEDRQAVAFVVSVDGAYRLAEEFERQGIRAAAACATTNKTERAQILADFRAGKLQVLCNVGLYTEGLDVPNVSCIHQVRPTKSDGLYIQMIGRGLRTYPDKEDCLILDYVPLEWRKITMLGDVLTGREIRKDSYINDEDDREDDDILGGFTFDGEMHWMTGSPADIITQQLNYLDISPWRWHRDKETGAMSLGMGENKKDGIKRVAYMGPIQDDGNQILYAVWSPPIETEYRINYYGTKSRVWKAKAAQVGDFDSLQMIAEDWAGKHAPQVLIDRTARWGKQPANDKSRGYAQNLHVWREGMTAGECSSAISHALACKAIKNV